MKLSAGRKLCFGVGALGKDLCYAMISTFLMIYFTDTVGLNPFFVGNLFLVARVWDAVNDPIMGFMVDNTRTRWGKFRPWILIGTLLNAVIMIFMFRNPNLEGVSLYVYYSVVYILWGMTYTVMDIPYWSMLPSLSSTQKERESMSVIPRIFASSAWLLMGAFGIATRNYLGNGDEAKGYSSMAVVISVIFIATILVTVLFVKDRSSLEAAEGKKAQRTSLKDAIHVITANDQLKVYIGVVLAYNLLVQLADVIDYGEVTLGTRNESIVASFQTLLVKTASAVAGWLIGVGLTISGYVENVPQTPQTILGMRVLMGVVPSIVTVLAFVIYAKGYKLDSSRMEEISNQLKAKKVEN